MSVYGEDLAFIHDTGFSDYAMGAAPGLLAILRRGGVSAGLVIDLGCGGGRWAAALARRGYHVLGIDRSPDFIRLARRNAPGAAFRTGSLWTAVLPQCDAVTSLGECLNYASGDRTSLARLFARIHAALRPRGLLVFDAAGPARIPPEVPRRSWREGDGWAVLVETIGHGNVLARRVVCYRKTGARYRRSEETHRLRLYAPEEILAALAAAGFRARAVGAYGRWRLPAGMQGFVAVKAR